MLNPALHGRMLCTAAYTLYVILYLINKHAVFALFGDLRFAGEVGMRCMINDVFSHSHMILVFLYVLYTHVQQWHAYPFSLY